MFGCFSWSLRHRLVVPFLLLVALGSLLIVVSVHAVYVREDAQALEAVLDAHAAFFRDTDFPPSTKLAGNLSQMSHATMAFLDRGKFLCADTNPPLIAALSSPLVGDGKARTKASFLVAAASLSEGFDIMIARPRTTIMAILRRPSVLSGLLAFWLTALVLGILISRGIVEPLLALVRALPQLGEEDLPKSLPAMERSDELGLLSRAILSTHGQLRAEREQRMRSERLAVLGRITTGLAHEIQNPVAAIRLHTQILQDTERSQRSRQQDESLPHVMGSLDRISALVNQWLFLARPEPPRLEPVDLDRLLDETRSHMHHLLHHGGTEIRLEGRAGLVVAADRRRMEHVMQNLVLNAVQAMGGRGVLTIGRYQKGVEVSVVFRDTGPGFSDEALRRGRELFFTEKEGGMGVGLTLCEDVVRAHGGTIQCGNHSGGGAEVCVILQETGSAS